MSTEPTLEHFADDGTFPNSELPLVIYRAALGGGPGDTVGPEAMEGLFAGNGWPPQWRAGIYAFPHYHSTSHECLGVASGRATLMFGGPKGREVQVKTGDVVVIPAGVAHQRIVASPDFLVVGAYPPDAAWDLLKGEPGDRPLADENIRRVPLPRTDPVWERGGGVLKYWATRQASD